MMFRPLLPLIAALSLALPGALPAQALPAPTAEAIAPETAAPDTAAPEAAHARPALWIVRDEDTCIYLFGTIHMLRPDLVWFEAPMKTAFDSAQELVLEIADQGNPDTQAKMLQLALASSAPPLSDRIPEETRQRYLDLLATYGVPKAALDPMKPWFAAITLAALPLQQLGYDPASGVEATLLKAAKAQGKTLIGLETSEEQLRLFDGLSPELQMELLVETIAEQDKIEESLAQMIDAWSTGDPDALAQTLNQSMDEGNPELEQRLLLDRNEHWAAWIETRLKTPGTVFLAVGAGHLAGKGSVQDALLARAIETRRVAAP